MLRLFPSLRRRLTLDRGNCPQGGDCRALNNRYSFTDAGTGFHLSHRPSRQSAVDPRQRHTLPQLARQRPDLCRDRQPRPDWQAQCAPGADRAGRDVERLRSLLFYTALADAAQHQDRLQWRTSARQRRDRNLGFELASAARTRPPISFHQPACLCADHAVLQRHGRYWSGKSSRPGSSTRLVQLLGLALQPSSGAHRAMTVW